MSKNPPNAAARAGTAKGKTATEVAGKGADATAADGRRAWQRMLSGRRLDLLDPSPLDVEIEDIAHGLARVARWNGQTSGKHAFSVAQHSLLVDDIAKATRANWPPHWQLAALLHDAPEYVVGDLISPFKAAIGDSYKAVEHRLQHAIHIRFGLPAVLPVTVKDHIKRADHIAAYFEAIKLAGFEQLEARKFFGSPRLLPIDLLRRLDCLQSLAAEAAQQVFLDRFAELQQSVSARIPPD